MPPTQFGLACHSIFLAFAALPLAQCGLALPYRVFLHSLCGYAASGIATKNLRTSRTVRRSRHRTARAASRKSNFYAKQILSNLFLNVLWLRNCFRRSRERMERISTVRQASSHCKSGKPQRKPCFNLHTL